MGNWTRTKAAGLLFVAAAAVYSDGLVRAMAAEKATPATPGNANASASAATPAKPAAKAVKPAAAAVATAPKAPAAKPATAKTTVAKAAAPAKAAPSKAAPAKAKPATTVAKAAPAPAKVKQVKSRVVANQAVEQPAVTATKSTSTESTAETKPSVEAPIDPFAEALPTPVVAERPASAAASLTDANVNVSDAGLVEIHVNDANLGEVLRMLSVQLERNIMASKEVRGTVTANLYDVTVKEALEAILRANDCGYREKGNVIYVYTAKELQEIEKAERKQVTETFRVHYTPAANAVTMIKPVLSPEAQVSFTTPVVVGLKYDEKDMGGNSHSTEDTIVVTDFPDRLEQVRRVLKEVDRRPQQILVEATILRATLKEDNELGVDFSVLGGVDFSGLTNTIGGGTIDPETQSMLSDKGAVFGQAGGGGLKVGVITNNVSVFVNALEGVTDTAVVANPKVLVLNKQLGAVHVGARLGYRTAVSTETLTADDVKFLEIGTRLAFRPFIGNDGYIRMEISPKDSSGNITNDLPNEFVTEVTSNVMVRDGRTIVIGGLFRESSDSTRSQVPGLGNIPVAGRLFKKQKDSTIREEVIVLLTPHLIKDEDAYEKLSEQELQSVERLRVGTRHGMMPWGRERLAESAYQKAVEELSKPAPDRKKALWHLDCATNLNPKFAEAIELKAQLTGEEVTSVDNSTVKSFVRRAVLMDRNRVTSGTSSTHGAGAAAAVAPAPTTAPAPAEAETAETDEVAAAEQGDLPTTQPSAEAADLTASTGEEPTTQPVAETPAEMPEEATVEAPTDEAAAAEPTVTEEVVVVEEAPAAQPEAEVVEVDGAVDSRVGDPIEDVLVEINVEEEVPPSDSK